MKKIAGMTLLLSALALAQDLPEKKPEAAVPAKPAPKVSPLKLEGDVGLGSAIYPQKPYLRIPLKLNLAKAVTSKMDLQMGFLYRWGRKPQTTSDLGMDMGLRYLFSEQAPFFASTKLGYQMQTLSWQRSNWSPAYEGTAYSPYIGATLGYEVRVGEKVVYTPELSWEYVPRSTYDKQLSGNTIYAPAHHNIDVSLGVRISL